MSNQRIPIGSIGIVEITGCNEAKKAINDSPLYKNMIQNSNSRFMANLKPEPWYIKWIGSSFSVINSGHCFSLTSGVHPEKFNYNTIIPN